MKLLTFKRDEEGFSFSSFHRFILSIQFFDLNVEDDLGKIRKADVLIKDYDIKTECTNFDTNVSLKILSLRGKLYI